MYGFDLPFPSQPGEQYTWSGLTGASQGLALANALEHYPGLLVVITQDTLSAVHLETEINFFKQSTQDIVHLPDWETLPYDHFSPHQDIISERLTTLYRLPQLNRGLLIVPFPTLLHRLCPPDFLQQQSFLLDRGETLSVETFKQRLVATGYRHVSQVMEHGEFTIRGSIIDLYPMGSPLPYRIDLFDDEVDSIRTFDPENQRTINKIEQIRLLPAREFPLNEEAISLFRQQWRDQFSGDPLNSTIYQDVSQGLRPQGIEYYLPLFFKQTATLFDYLPEKTCFIKRGDVYQAGKAFLEQTEKRFEQLRYDTERPLLAPEQLFLNQTQILHELDHFPQITLKESEEEPYNFATHSLPDISINNQSTEPLAKLKQFIQEHPQRILFCAESAGRREVLLKLLQETGIQPKVYDHFQNFLNADTKLNICVGAIDQGFMLTEPSLVLIGEAQIFGAQVLQQRRRKQARTYDPETVIRNLVELQIGTPIVHIDHGIGRYQGLKTITTNAIENEYLCIEYAEQDKLYVPIASLHLISRYSGMENQKTPLHRLGNESWQRNKKKAAKKIHDIAVELLEIHARREASEGRRCQVADEDYQRFSRSFPFEETPDQQQAIEAVRQDLLSPKKMDRLVCGDVGFGKTEVAMRASFLAANSSIQTAILTPTTLLAQQHYDNFCDRFADWPVNIELLSRFRTKKQQTQIIKDLQEGKIDIIIGTHRLLQKDIRFHDLGLLIIDEEHRFGVKHKEKLKSLRENVNILTLTATPIPRTLNLSLSGLRDLSIIATPPSRRLSIKTFVHHRQDALISEAIRRELLRGGQIYFLHNNIKTIDRVRGRLTKLIPEARVEFAHGQMRERQLEKIMADFYHQRFNVLVCTTIIESGIDIPTANTIIIDRADHFGLSQLHQLRGRVGRSHHQAYAYLLIPDLKLITQDAKQRLEAITTFEDLGAGFLLASQDLEIRGAGEILGQEQSGHIEALGFSLYMELLERTVEAIRRGDESIGEKLYPTQTEIDLQISALIPQAYLDDVHARLILYKRINNAKTQNELDDLQVEMIDRFGLLPVPTQHLFKIMSLKQLAESLGITKIEAGNHGGRVEFTSNPNIDVTHIVNLLKTHPQRYGFEQGKVLRFTQQTASGPERITYVENLLQKLKP